MDKYDKAIDKLLESNDLAAEIYLAWKRPDVHLCGCLFYYTSESGVETLELLGNICCGCLTQIATGNADSIISAALYDEIRNRHEFNVDFSDILNVREFLDGKSEQQIREWLETFAHYQRKVDAEVRL